MDEIIKSIPSATRYFFGLIFIFSLLALVSSLVAEAISGMLRLRSRTLEMTVRSLLGEDVATKFYSHPFIAGLARAVPTDIGKPAYIPSGVFALVLLDIISPRYMSESDPLAAIRKGVHKLKDPGLKDLLDLFLGEAQGDIGRLQERIRFWFDYSMDRFSPLYRRKIQARVLIPLAFVLSFALNGDAIRMAKTLSESEHATSVILQAAQKRINDLKMPGEAEESRRIVADVVSQLDELSLLGWSADRASLRAVPLSAKGWFMKVMGLFISAVAVAFLAPILFGLLNKVVGLRDAEQKPIRGD